MSALVRLVIVQPIVGGSQADHALANGQEPRTTLLATAHRTPAAVVEEHAAPGIEAVGDQRSVVTEQVAPFEARALQKVDLGHDKVGDRRRTRALPEGVTAKRTLAA